MKIIAAAVLLPNGAILTKPPPARHPDLRLTAERFGNWVLVNGFLTDSGEFVDRRDAYSIAEAAGQIVNVFDVAHVKGRLYSEDLW